MEVDVNYERTSKPLKGCFLECFFERTHRPNFVFVHERERALDFKPNVLSRPPAVPCEGICSKRFY